MKSVKTHSVAFVDPRAGPASHSQEELQAEVGNVPQGEGILPVQVDSLNSVGGRDIRTMIICNV